MNKCFWQHKYGKYELYNRYSITRGHEEKLVGELFIYKKTCERCNNIEFKKKVISL